MHPLADIEHEHGYVTLMEERNAGGLPRGARAQEYATSVGPAPCETCHLAARCGAKLLACTAFYNYAERNQWSAFDRNGATRALYRSVMASS
jgi:hypothetical protein